MIIYLDENDMKHEKAIRDYVEQQITWNVNLACLEYEIIGDNYSWINPEGVCEYAAAQLLLDIDTLIRGVA